MEPNKDISKAAALISTCFSGLSVSVLEGSELKIEGFQVTLPLSLASEIANTPYGKLVADEFINNSLQPHLNSVRATLKRQLKSYAAKQKRRRKI